MAKKLDRKFEVLQGKSWNKRIRRRKEQDSPGDTWCDSWWRRQRAGRRGRDLIQAIKEDFDCLDLVGPIVVTAEPVVPRELTVLADHYWGNTGNGSPTVPHDVERQPVDALPSGLYRWGRDMRVSVY